MVRADIPVPMSAATFLILPNHASASSAISKVAAKARSAFLTVSFPNAAGYSSFISNSYKAIAENDTSDSKAVSTAILDYAKKYNSYVDAISKKNN